ncbi:MAG: MaoC family dehydratase [Smithellaceae bacterium]
MAASMNLTFTKAPSLILTSLSALWGYRWTFDPAKSFPMITARRNAIGPDLARLTKFAKICGIEISDKLPLIYPLTHVYPLVQMMLARKEAPLSLLKTLNTRMQIRQHRLIGVYETCDVHCRLAGHRTVEKGLEVDIACVLQISGQTVWECVITFYYRGQIDAPDKTFTPPVLETIPDAPETARWFLPSGIGYAFAKLSGDGNPIHYWSWYAKLSGFKRAFAQPLLVLAETLSLLEKKHPADRLCLNIAFKGPVYYKSQVILKSLESKGNDRFDIYCEGNPRPCICGYWQPEC